MKKQKIEIYLFIAVIILIAFYSIYSYNTQQKSDLVKTSPRLYLVNLVNNDNIISGNLENPFNKTINKIVITFKFYDKNGKLIDSSKSSITNLKPHEFCNVEAVTPETKIRFERYDYEITFEW